MTVVKVKLTSANNAAHYHVEVNSVIELPLEQYVMGVTAAEIGNSSIEACKAQAIAARTAAYPYYNKNLVISDSSSSLQCFNATRLANVSKSYPNVKAAVEATEGQLLMYNGSVITTCSYCASNGGHTVSSKERWGGERAWLISQPDPWDAAVSNGKRNGHGVGMSQVGAAYAAKNGKDCAAILAFYYPGTTIYRPGNTATTTAKEATTMAKTVTVSAFVAMAIKIFNTFKVKYNNGSSGQKSGDVYLCDCRGYIIWILRMLGLNISSTGTNWMIRNQMTEVHRVTSASQLEVGQAVFKSKTDISEMPSRYRKGAKDYNAYIGELEVYHVGVVIQTSPTLIIRHCTAGGIKTDTKLGNWNWAGYVQWVTPDQAAEPTPAPAPTPEPEPTPTAPAKVARDGATGVYIGSAKLNLRKAPSKSAPRVEYILPDDSVELIRANVGVDGWYYVRYGKKVGYVMAEFIRIIS